MDTSFGSRNGRVDSDPYCAVVDQAAGMLTVQLGVDIPEAMARLRAHAVSTNRSTSDVAHDIVDRALFLSRAEVD